MTARGPVAELLEQSWQLLRTELGRWDDDDPGLTGFDGFSRFWCPIAVLDVYWVAEAQDAGPMELMLTSDVLLTGFRDRRGFELDPADIEQLARHAGWQEAASSAIEAVMQKQYDLFQGDSP